MGSGAGVAETARQMGVDWQPLFGQFFQRLRPAFLNSTGLTQPSFECSLEWMCQRTWSFGLTCSPCSVEKLSL